MEEIVSRSVEESTGGVCVQGLLLNNLRFADDIAVITNNNSDQQDLGNRLNTESTRFGMEISAEKSKTLVVGKTPETLRSPVKLSGKQLEQAKQFKYLGCNMPDTGRSTNEVKMRAAMAMSSLIKVDKLWKSQKISFGVKLRLLRSIVIPVLLYGCESCTYSEEILKKFNAFECMCYRRLLGISWRDRRTNESVKEHVEGLAGVQKPLIQIVQERKMKFFGHVTRHPSELRLANTIMHGRVPGDRGRGRPRRSWVKDICEWTRRKPSQAIRLAEIGESRIIHNQSAPTDPEISLT